MNNDNEIVELCDNMTDLLKHQDIFYLPHLMKSEEGYVETLKKKFEDFLTFSNDQHIDKKLDVDLSILDIICNSILSSIEFYYNGEIEKSYKTVESLFIEHQDIFFIGSLKRYFDRKQGNDFTFYRARVASNVYEKDLDPLELFHIPFNKRHLIQNQRYSLNGIPCLYLGKSVYVCWEELGRIDINKLNVSAFTFNEDSNINILYLAYTLQEVVNFFYRSQYNEANFLKMEAKEWLKKYFYTWTLQAACSIYSNDTNRNYKEEYIFPQILMNVLKKLDIQGIAYFSTKGIYNKAFSGNIFVNLALPAYQEKNESHSISLTSTFKATRSLNYGIWSEIYDKSQKLGDGTLQTPEKAMSVKKMMVNDELEIFYKDTSFYRFEETLNSLTKHNLED